MSKNIPITAVDQYDFLEHRREQEKKHWDKQAKNQDKLKLEKIAKAEAENPTINE